MENKVKGTRYDIRNNSRYYWYCSDDYQYHRYNDQYHTDRQETKKSKKQPPLAKVEVAFFDKHL